MQKSQIETPSYLYFLSIRHASKGVHNHYKPIKSLVVLSVITFEFVSSSPKPKDFIQTMNTATDLQLGLLELSCLVVFFVSHVIIFLRPIAVE